MMIPTLTRLHDVRNRMEHNVANNVQIQACECKSRDVSLVNDTRCAWISTKVIADVIAGIPRLRKAQFVEIYRAVCDHGQQMHEAICVCQQRGQRVQDPILTEA